MRVPVELGKQMTEANREKILLWILLVILLSLPWLAF